jgi:hypothetical protein
MTLHTNVRSDCLHERICAVTVAHR